MRRLAALLAAAVMLVAPVGLAAQAGWALELGAGRAVHDPLAARVGTDNLVVAARYQGGRPEWLHFSGGTPLSSVGSPWLAMGIGDRLGSEAIDLPLALDVGLNLFGYRYSVADSLAGPGETADSLAGGGTLELLPLLFGQLGPVQVELQSGLVLYSLLQGGEASTRSIHHSVARASYAAARDVELNAESRLVRAPEGSYPYLGGEVNVVHGRAFGWAAAGRWLSDELPTAVYGGGVGLALNDRLAVQAAWQQEASDPLYWNPPRRSWGARLTYLLGGQGDVPSPVAVPARDGRVVVRIPIESAPQAPYVIGDFTGWEPVEMQREGRFWSVSLAIPPGVYHYGFRTADGRWFLPAGTVARVSDGMGGTSAVLVVP